MADIDIIRALKDPEYRDSLSEEERSLVPQSQAGIIELDDHVLTVVSGGDAAADGSFSCSYRRCRCQLTVNL